MSIRNTNLFKLGWIGVWICLCCSYIVVKVLIFNEYTLLSLIYES